MNGNVVEEKSHVYSDGCFYNTLSANKQSINFDVSPPNSRVLQYLEHNNNNNDNSNEIDDAALYTFLYVILRFLFIPLLLEPSSCY